MHIVDIKKCRKKRRIRIPCNDSDCFYYKYCLRSKNWNNPEIERPKLTKNQQFKRHNCPHYHWQTRRCEKYNIETNRVICVFCPEPSHAPLIYRLKFLEQNPKWEKIYNFMTSAGGSATIKELSQLLIIDEANLKSEVLQPMEHEGLIIYEPEQNRYSVQTQ